MALFRGRVGAIYQPAGGVPAGLSRYLLALVPCLWALAAAAEPAETAAGPQEMSPSPAGYRLETVAEGLAFPWRLAFLPNGDALVTERGGALRILRGGVLDPAPIAGVPPVFVAGQGGLFDVLLHPQFAADRWLYLSYAHGGPAGNATRLARARFDGERLTDLEVLFTVAPLKRPPLHYGGRMLFLPDGTLLLTTGDGFVHREAAQRLDNLLGKVVRLNADGTVPADNPFVGDANAQGAIWTYGHRNPQGLALAAGPSGEAPRVYLHEHGPRGGDELNLLVAGRNYGWPVATFGIDYNGASISPFTEYPGMEGPLVDWTPSIAPAGLAFYDGDAFPAWRGDLFVASLVFRNGKRIDLEAGGVRDQEVVFSEVGERLRDVIAGPDGLLYLLTDSAQGRVIRVAPAAGET